MSKPKIIFICHRIPYPPNRGDKIRSYNLLKQLSKEYEVFLGCCYEYREEIEHLDKLTSITSDIYYARKPNSLLHLGLDVFKALMTGKSISEQHFYHSGLQDWVNSIIKQHDIAGVFVYCSSMASYISNHLPDKCILVADLIDLDSLKWSSLADKKTSMMRWLYKRESKKIASLERRIINHFDYTFFVSELERELCQKQFDSLPLNCGVIENGVDYTYFNDQGAQSLSPSYLNENYILFTGSMDAIHNIESITWFVKNCWPELAEMHNDLHLYIVGRHPNSEVKKYATNRIKVISNVPDIRPFLLNATVTIAPMVNSRGVQNKVLEAMASGKAFVTTIQGAEGISFPAEQEPYICSTANEFVIGVSKLLKNTEVRERIGELNKSWAQNHYSWESKLTFLNQYFHGKKRDKK